MSEARQRAEQYLENYRGVNDIVCEMARDLLVALDRVDALEAERDLADEVATMNARTADALRARVEALTESRDGARLCDHSSLD